MVLMKISYRSLIAIVTLGVVILILGKVFWTGRMKKLQYVSVSRKTLVEAIYGIGEVIAVRSYQAKVGVSSSIDRLPIREGSVLNKGDLIAHMSEGFGIYAPFKGVVAKVYYKIGETILPGNIIADLMDPSLLEIKVILDQRSAVKAKVGQLARLSFDGLREKIITGKVRSVFSSGSRFTVMIDSRNLPKEILPGMTADVSIEVDRKEHVIVIPEAAIEGGRVRRVRKNKTDLIPIQTGLVNNGSVEIIDGDLVDGDSVIIGIK